MGWFTGSSPKVTAMPAWSPEQQLISGQLSSYLSSNLGRDTTYPGMSELTKLKPVERESMGLMERLMSGKDTYGAEELLKQIISGRPVEDLLQPERAKRYTAATITGPIMQRLEEEMLPSIAASAGKGGAYFSTMRGVEENKARRYAGEEIGRGEETFSYQQLLQQIQLEEAERNRQQEAMQTGLQYPLTKAATGMQIGAAARQPQLYGLQDWLASQENKNALLTQLQNYLKQQPYQYVTDTGQKGAGSSLMSLAALALL